MHAYTLRQSSRARHLRLTLQPSGELVVSGPLHVSGREIEKFVERNEEWIIAKKEEMRASAVRRSQGIERAKQRLIEEGIDPIALPAPTKAHYDIHRTQASNLATERVHYFINHYAQKYNIIFSPVRISIKNHRSRWGSCSSKSNLNFNYRIIFLPEKILNYIVVHELCHLKQMNHSQNFWNLVALEFPDYKKIHKNLTHLARIA